MGLAGSIAVTIAWSISCASFAAWSPTQSTSIRLTHGGLVWVTMPHGVPPEAEYPRTRQWLPGIDEGMSFDVTLPGPETMTVSVRYITRSTFLPLWVPALTFVIPTVLLWYRDRRPPKGHCQNCGYNLTGNVTGVCPECGQAT